MFESHCCCCCFQGRSSSSSMLVYCHVSCLQTHHHESSPPSLLAECLSSPQPSRIIYLLFHFHTCTQLLQPDKNLNPSSSSLQLLHSVDCGYYKMFLQLSVILFTGGGLPQCMLGYHTPRLGSPRSRHPPGADTPRSRPPCAVHAGRYGQQAGGMHLTGMQSCVILSVQFARTNQSKLLTHKANHIGKYFSNT